MKEKKLDPERCRYDLVQVDRRWPDFHQCYNKPKRDGYCTMHHPDTVKMRAKKIEERQRQKMDRHLAPYNAARAADKKVRYAVRKLREIESVASSTSSEIRDLAHDAVTHLLRT